MMDLIGTILKQDGYGYDEVDTIAVGDTIATIIILGMGTRID